MAFKNIGVIFLNKKLTTKNGKEYFSGKTADAGEKDFDIMAFINESKSGKTKYMSIMQVTKDDNYQQKSKDNDQGEEPKKFEDEQIDVDDLPF